jgi:hypothetical protein
MSMNSSGRRSAFGPETVRVLQNIFDDCVLKLGLVQRTKHSYHLQLEEQLARRIITAAERGIERREQIEALALDGLLPPIPTRREGQTFRCTVEGEREL